MPEAMAPTEILALARILDELDYYQILHVGQDASMTEVRRAYHQSSRAFHPDANRHLAGEQREAVVAIARRVTEAYTVLRDPRRRRAYDEALAQGRNRMQIAEAEAGARQQATDELEGRTPNGRKFSALARADLQRGNLAAALRNLQTALTFEPGNDRFRKKLAELKERIETERRTAAGH